MKNKQMDESILESLVKVKRVTKVVEGGRKFSFSACVVVGDKAGRIGYAHGKANEVSEARQKASFLAKKRLKRIPLYQNRTIHHDIEGKSGTVKVILRRAKAGTGIIAGGAMRSVLELLGVADVVAKSIGSSNVYSMIEATFNALESLYTPKIIAEKRGKKISELFVKKKYIKESVLQ